MEEQQIPHPIHSNYLISSFGTCYSLKKKRYLKPDINSSGYERYYINGKRKFTHRLVAETFITNYDELPCVDHMDRNRKNNNVNNLRWINYSNNSLNKELNKNNKLGIKNISYCTRDNLYAFNKCVLGKRTTKFFKVLEDAVDYKVEWHEKNNIMLL